MSMTIIGKDISITVQAPRPVSVHLASYQSDWVLIYLLLIFSWTCNDEKLVTGVFVWWKHTVCGFVGLLSVQCVCPDPWAHSTCPALLSEYTSPSPLTGPLLSSWARPSFGSHSFQGYPPSTAFLFPTILPFRLSHKDTWCYPLPAQRASLYNLPLARFLVLTVHTSDKGVEV